MKKLLFLLTFFLTHNFLFAQDSIGCDKCLKSIVKSSSDYIKKFRNNNIYIKKYVSDVYLEGGNYFITIYFDNKEVGVFNRIATYKLNTNTKQLSSEVLGSDKYLPVSYNKKLADDIKGFVKKHYPKIKPF